MAYFGTSDAEFFLSAITVLDSYVFSTIFTYVSGFILWSISLFHYLFCTCHLLLTFV
jgi:hypothetical protein